jgi:hypothetical protein
MDFETNGEIVWFKVQTELSKLRKRIKIRRQRKRGERMIEGERRRAKCQMSKQKDALYEETSGRKVTMANTLTLNLLEDLED